MSDLISPPGEIRTADPPRKPGGSPTRKHHVATGQVQLLCDLAPGLAAPDDEHSTGRQLARVPVVLDIRRQQLSGVRTTTVIRGELSQLLRGVGTIAYDETRLTDVNLKVDGWIRELHVNYTGQQVHQGQPLFTLYSQELVGAQLQYLAALRARAQLTPAQAADREYQERLIETPRGRLLFLDFPEDQLRVVEKIGESGEVARDLDPRS